MYHLEILCTIWFYVPFKFSAEHKEITMLRESQNGQWNGRKKSGLHQVQFVLGLGWGIINCLLPSFILYSISLLSQQIEISNRCISSWDTYMASQQRLAFQQRPECVLLVKLWAAGTACLANAEILCEANKPKKGLQIILAQVALHFLVLWSLGLLACQ